MTDEQAAALRACIARQVEAIPLEVIHESFRRLDAKEPEAMISCQAGLLCEDRPVAAVVLVIEPHYLIKPTDVVVEFPNGVFARLSEEQAAEALKVKVEIKGQGEG